MNIDKVKNFSEKKLGVGGFFGQLFNSYRSFFIFLSIVIFFSIYIGWFKKTQTYRLLYDHLSSIDGGAIVKQLKQMNIPYQFTEDSGLLLVPSNQVYETRFRLSEQGLPKGSGVGFELLDKDKFGSSQFSEKINYQRALEGELARSILKIGIIKDVRIHISLPTESLFFDKKKPPSASIVLSMNNRQVLDQEQINAIVHLVSNSISGLSINNITVIDELGHLLTFSDKNESNLNHEQLNYTKLIEDRYSSRIEKILTPLVGPGNVHAEVTAKINFNIVNRSEDRYNPNFYNQNKSIRSEQIVNHSQQIIDNLKQSPSHHSISNIKNNQNIKNQQTFHKDSKNGMEQNINDYDINNSCSKLPPINSDNQKDNTINYELDHIVSTTKIHTGDIQHLSVAVILNYSKNKKGEMIPINKNLLQKMNSLVKETIGYSKVRNDSINLVNAPFFKNEQVLIKYVKIPIIKNKNTENLLFKCFISILGLMLILIFYYQYKIRKYKKQYILNFSKNKKINNENSKNFNSQLNKKYEQQNKKNIFDSKKDISNVSNDIKDESYFTALMIKKWMSGDIKHD